MIALDFVNIAAHLPAMARDRPHALAVICPAGRDHAGRPRHTHWTFRQLDRESDAIAHGLTSVGIGRGVRTVLMVKPSLEFFALTFALFKAGAVPVLIDPGLGIRNLGPCLAEAAPEAFIGIPRAQVGAAGPGLGSHDDQDRRDRRAALAGRRDRRSTTSAARARPMRPSRSPARGPTRPRPSSSPAAARGSPRGRSTPTRSSRRRSRCSATSTGSSPARSTSAPSRCSPCSPRRWG